MLLFAAKLINVARRGKRRFRPTGLGGRWLLTLLLIAGLNAGTFPAGARDEFPEYQLKAAFLYNFAKFVNWPTNSFADARAPLAIAVLGTDPFGPLLKDTV